MTYKTNKGKILEVTEDGLRNSVYPDGRITTQMPGQPHSDYKAKIQNRVTLDNLFTKR